MRFDAFPSACLASPASSFVSSFLACHPRHEEGSSNTGFLVEFIGGRLLSFPPCSRPGFEHMVFFRHAFSLGSRCFLPPDGPFTDSDVLVLVGGARSPSLPAPWPESLFATPLPTRYSGLRWDAVLVEIAPTVMD